MNVKPVIWFDESGPLIRYNREEEMLEVHDLNPEQRIRFRISRLEMFQIGANLIMRSLFG